MLDGALIVDKPTGPTSHDVVACVRRALKLTRVGHTGTLDPLATGVLVLLLGKATRLAQFLVADDKEYLADVRLGLATDSYDAATLPHGTPPADVRISPEDVEFVLQRFRGTFEQTPPPFSAKKVAGRRAYEHARRQDAIELRAVEVTVHRLEAVAFDVPGVIRLRIVCSSGFYVRSLAHDIGKHLGCGAYLEGLRRTRAGRFSIEKAQPLDTIERNGSAGVIPLASLLDHLPAVTLSAEGTRRAAHGNWLTPGHLAGGSLPAPTAARVRLVDPDGSLLGIADRGADALLHPIVVLV